MSYAISSNAYPRTIFSGADDQSIVLRTPEPISKPIHFPHVFTFASRMVTDDAYMVLGDGMLKLYGSDLLDMHAEHATFNTPFIELFNKSANPMYVHCLSPDDAKRATLRVFAEVYKDNVPVYVFDEDGSVTYDANGKIVTSGTAEGYTVIWHTAAFEDDKPFKNGVVYAGTRVGVDGVKSKIYPIFDAECSFIGAKGNDIGIRMSMPNNKSNVILNGDIMNAIGSRLLSVQFVERDTDTRSPVITRTLGGSTSINVSLLKGAYYRPMRQVYDYRKLLLNSWRNLNPGRGLPPEIGPVRNFWFYQENYEEVANLLAGAVGSAYSSEPYMLDILTGKDIAGNPYQGFVVDTGALGGEVFTEAHTHYLQGGSNGTMNNETFDLLVRREMNNFGNGSIDYLNMSKYPFKFFWDPGYTTDTKQALAKAIGRRPDTVVVLSTFVYNQGENTLETEDAMKIAISSFLRAYPDSAKFATSAYRGWTVGHSFYLNDSAYTELVPVSYALARMVSLYGGSNKFKPAYRFDRGELAIITDGYGINLTSKTPSKYASDWDAGLINVRSFDQYQYSFPATKTTYTNDTSILTGILNSIIFADLNQICNDVWNECSGNQRLDNDELVDLINSKIIAKTEGRYDEVSDIVPAAYFTEEDLKLGYSVHIRVHVYGEVQDTVGEVEIVAHRKETE